MKHEGEIVKKAVLENGIPITVLAKKLNKSRGWFYSVFNSSSVSIDKILKIGKVINHNFAREIEKLKKGLDLNEPVTTYSSRKNSLNEKSWQEKYLSLLEEYNKLLKEHIKQESHSKKKR